MPLGPKDRPSASGTVALEEWPEGLEGVSARREDLDSRLRSLLRFLGPKVTGVCLRATAREDLPLTPPTKISFPFQLCPVRERPGGFLPLGERDQRPVERVVSELQLKP